MTSSSFISIAHLNLAVVAVPLNIPRKKKLTMMIMMCNSHYVKQIHETNSNFLQPKAVFFTCMDSRMIPTRFTQTNVGDMFVGECLHSFRSLKEQSSLFRILQVSHVCLSPYSCTYTSIVGIY